MKIIWELFKFYLKDKRVARCYCWYFCWECDAIFERIPWKICQLDLSQIKIEYSNTQGKNSIPFPLLVKMENGNIRVKNNIFLLKYFWEKLILNGFIFYLHEIRLNIMQMIWTRSSLKMSTCTKAWVFLMRKMNI